MPELIHDMGCQYERIGQVGKILRCTGNGEFLDFIFELLSQIAVTNLIMRFSYGGVLVMGTLLGFILDVLALASVFWFFSYFRYIISSNKTIKPDRIEN